MARRPLWNCRIDQEGVPLQVANRIQVTVDVAVANSGDGSPKVINVLRFEVADITVGKSDIDQCEEPAVLPKVEPLLLGNGPGYSVPGLPGGFVPMPGDLDLFFGAQAAAYPTDQL